MKEVYEPIGDRVIVKPFEKQSKTSSGIIIPETAQTDSQRGEVVAVGNDCIIKKGDIVLFGKHSGTKIENGLRVFQESHILSIIKNK